jgi:hypothetical protein
MFGHRYILLAVQVAVVGILVSSVSATAVSPTVDHKPTGEGIYEASVERVFAAEMQAFGVPPTDSVKDQCLVHYKSTTGSYVLSWTATCKDIGNGKVSVHLTVQGYWFFGIGPERKRITNVFWNNMNAVLKNTAASGDAPSPSPQIAPSPSPLIAQPSSPLIAQPASGTPASETSAMVHISSDPGGADILIDGDYNGSTPSQIKLSSGTHSVKIVKKGFEAWERSIKVESGESRNIDAELQRVSRW